MNPFSICLGHPYPSLATSCYCFLLLFTHTKLIPFAWTGFLPGSHMICFLALFRSLVKSYLPRKALPVASYYLPCLHTHSLSFSLSLSFPLPFSSCHYLTS